MLAFSVSSQANDMTLYFDTDGQLPDAENAGLTRVSSNGMDDEVAGGLWKGNPDDIDDGVLYYYGDNPALASSDTNLPVSINVRTRLLASCIDAPTEYYYTMRGPHGSIYLVFYYDANDPDESKIGGRHQNGSYMYRYLPPGKTLGEFHNYAVTFHPAEGAGSAPARLWVDGEYVGDTYVHFGVNSNTGYVEFGDSATSPGSIMWETEWVRFGLDENVYTTEPVDAVDASTFGFAPGDATSALQAAIDTGARRVIVPNMGTDWLVSTIMLTMSNQDIILEEGANITGKAGASFLFSTKDAAISLSNFKMIGSGNVLTNSNGHVFGLYSPYHVTVSGMTITDAGIDGVYIGQNPFRSGLVTHNITLQDVVIDNATRNGISIITADKLLIDNCIIINTSGASPQSGIDFEPNNESNYLTDCVVRNTISSYNVNQSVVLQLDHLSEANRNAATITIENCTFVGGGGGAGMWVTLGLPGLVVKDNLFVNNHNFGVLQTSGTAPPATEVTYSAFWGVTPVGGDAMTGAGTVTGIEPLFASHDINDYYYMYLSPDCSTAITEGASDNSSMGARPVGPGCADIPDGDFNSDCYVNLVDFSLLAIDWSPDWDDWLTLAEHWSSCTDPAAPCNFNP